MDIKKDNLEKALGNENLQRVLHSSSDLNSGKPEREKQPEVPRDVEVGFHQGALNTLINERNELIRIVQQVEALMGGHMKRLEELGVKIKIGDDKK